mgnify:CR=1 FL=1
MRSAFIFETPRTQNVRSAFIFASPERRTGVLRSFLGRPERRTGVLRSSCGALNVERCVLRSSLDAPNVERRVLRSTFVSGHSQMHSQILEASPGRPTYLNSCHFLTPPRHQWSTLAELDYPRRRPEAADAREPGCAPHGASVGQDVRTLFWQLLLSLLRKDPGGWPSPWSITYVMRGNLCLSLLRKDRGPGPVHGVSRT